MSCRFNWIYPFVFFGALFIGQKGLSDRHEPSFEAVGLNKTLVMTKQQLRDFGTEIINMDYNRAYPNENRDYQSVKLCRLLQSFNLSPNSVLEFIAEDEFSVFIPANYVMQCGAGRSVAYLAIEPKETWPVLFNHTGTTAGPFALIWTKPHLFYISDEYWAWSITKLVEHKSIDKKAVIQAPSSFVSQDSKPHILNGHKVYVSHCASCHTINHQGQARIGPDLNQPKNPIDYYPEITVLKQFIRNPQSVRQLPRGRMSGSSYVGLNEQDLDDLIVYFHYVKEHDG